MCNYSVTPGNSNVIKLAALHMRKHGKERVHPETDAPVPKKGHDEKADQRVCKKDYTNAKIYATLLLRKN